MSAAFFSVIIYILGFIGLAAIGVIPIRSWGELQYCMKFGSSVSGFGKLPIAALILAVVAALWGDVIIVMRIFKCLTTDYCGPAIASGWSYLATLGFMYMIFEGIVLVLKRYAKPPAIGAASQ